MKVKTKARELSVEGVRKQDEHNRPGDTPLTGGIQLRRAVRILKPAEALYDFWHDFSNLPRIMPNLDDVRLLDSHHSRWQARVLDRTFTWDAELITDEPPHRLSWRSIENSDVENSGSVTFEQAPGDRGTDVKVVLTYNPPAGPAGQWLAKWLGEEPASQLAEDLRRFKQLMEAGEIPTNARRLDEIVHAHRREGVLR